MGDYDMDYYGGPEGDGDGDYEDDAGREIDYDEGLVMSLGDLWGKCLIETLSYAFDQVSYLFCCCLVLRLLNRFLNVGRPVNHACSALLGLVALFSIIKYNTWFVIVMALGGYVIVRFCCGRPGISHAVASTVGLLGYLVAREYVGGVSSSWEQVRGTQMIMVMKILSICFDMGIGYQTMVPSFCEYIGYVLCPANVVFGPWISFDVYCRFIEGQSQGIRWVFPALAASVCSVVSLGVSSCLVFWVFLGVDSKWILAYRDAASVRFSHYFISYLSEFCCLLCGFENESEMGVTEPWKIEMPRSLVEVVVVWNKPMHRWLRLYIFRPSLAYGAFRAVLCTFAVSSMLHGLNFGLTSVLLSLGFYTYVEHTLREKLATIFDACVRSRKCPVNCGHKYKWDNLLVIFVNLGFVGLGVFNLAYLGVMMSKTYTETEVPKSTLDSIYEDITKWSNLNFLSHWLMLSIYVGTAVI